MKQRMKELEITEAKDMITPTEAAAILNVSRTTLQRLIKSGELPTPATHPLLKRPRRMLLDRADVERLKDRAASASE